MDLIFEEFVYFLKNKAVWTQYPMDLIRNVQRISKPQFYFSIDFGCEVSVKTKEVKEPIPHRREICLAGEKFWPDCTEINILNKHVTTTGNAMA